MKKIRNKISLNLHKFMIMPAAVLFLIFFVLPLCQGAGISMTDWNGFSEEKNFVGFANFIRFFSDKRALHAIQVTVIFGLISPFLLNVAGLLLALLVDSKKKSRVLLRMVIYLPSIISPLIMGYLWTLILSPRTGVLDQILQRFEPSLSFDWMGVPDKALWLIIIVNVWQFVGGPMMVYLAGLQSIPKELYESATIDGAGKVQAFQNITWPLLYPSAKINIFNNIIGSMAVFDIIMAITLGGPGYATESLSIYIYRQSFNGFAGYATAIALIMFLIIAVPIGLTLGWMRNKEIEM